MTIRPNPGEPLPEFVQVSHQMIIGEAAAMRPAVEGFSDAPQPGCPHELDDKAWPDGSIPQARGRRQLLALMRRQALLTYLNAYDHLVTLGRALGGDGSLSLFSHSSISRVACEAAVRLAWLLDSGISPEERIMRGAAANLASSDERLKGANRVSGSHPPQVRARMVTNCIAERDAARAMIREAGIGMVWSRDQKKIASLKLASPRASVPVKLDISELMDALLPQSPTWYNIGSAVTHSQFWGLRDVVASASDEHTSLFPDSLELGAAAESAISASGLIVARHATYYGHDPGPHVEQAAKRREAIDLHMRRIGAARAQQAR